MPDHRYKPTSGFYVAWSLYAARLCTQINLYGFSDNGHSTHYFAFQNQKDKDGQITWVPREAPALRLMYKVRL
jgi:hypothetical protein